jgi:hypothetical protein
MGTPNSDDISLYSTAFPRRTSWKKQPYDLLTIPYLLLLEYFDGMGAVCGDISVVTYTQRFACQTRIWHLERF